MYHHSKPLPTQVLSGESITIRKHVVVATQSRKIKTELHSLVYMCSSTVGTVAHHRTTFGNAKMQSRFRTKQPLVAVLTRYYNG